MDTVNIKELNERIQLESSFVDLLTMEMNKAKKNMHIVNRLLFMEVK